jgi:hypothetical protein
MTVTLTDITVWRGNTRPAVVWQLPEDLDLGTKLFVLTIWVADALILEVDTTGRLYLDEATRRLAWDRTLAQSRAMPLGRLARYELEHRSFGEETLFHGAVVGLGGDNTDGEEPSGTGALDFFNPFNTGFRLLGWI